VYAFTDGGKTKPGMIRVGPVESGSDVFLVLWDMPMEHFGRFMMQVGPSQGISCPLCTLPPLPLCTARPWPTCSIALTQIPAPLGIGTVELDDGSQVKGFICEGWVADAAKAGDPNVKDITALGSWLTFIEQQQQQQA